MEERPIPPAGAVVAGRYRVVRPLKAGGMGAVHEVIDLTTDRRRALKLLLPNAALDTDLAARFRREATVAGRVESAHVVEVFDAGIGDDGVPFLVMELLQGEDLGAVLSRGPLPPPDVVAYLGQVALGLERTHTERIVHRDLKPENLFLTERDDGSPCVKILDFGIAKTLADVSGAVGTTRNLGTPLYMAPEQLRGDAGIDTAVDLYALAHIAYALLAGAPYFAEELKAAPNLFAFLTKVAQGPTEPATVRAARASVILPATFDAWFVRAAAPDPSLRFEHASDQVRELACSLGVAVPAALGSRPPRKVANTTPAGPPRLEQAREPSTTVVVAPATRPRPVGARVAAVVALVALAIVAGASWLTVRLAGEPAAGGAAASQPVASPAPPETSGDALPAGTMSGRAADLPAAGTAPAVSGSVGVASGAPAASAPARAPAAIKRPATGRAAPRPDAAPSAAKSTPRHDPLDEL